MKRILILSVVFVAALVVGIVVATDDRGNANDPLTNDRANACFTGGSIQGLCDKTDADRDGDVDQLDIEFMWWCGWYIIRAERGIIPASDTPEGCYYEPVIAPIIDAIPETIVPVVSPYYY